MENNWGFVSWRSVHLFLNWLTVHKICELNWIMTCSYYIITFSLICIHNLKLHIRILSTNLASISTWKAGIRKKNRNSERCGDEETLLEPEFDTNLPIPYGVQTEMAMEEFEDPNVCSASTSALRMTVVGKYGLCWNNCCFATSIIQMNRSYTTPNVKTVMEARNYNYSGQCSQICPISRICSLKIRSIYSAENFAEKETIRR